MIYFEEHIKNPNLKYDQVVPDRLLCFKCNKVLCNPYTIPCGHNYCYACIVSHLESSEDKLCMGNELNCKKEELNLSNNVLENLDAFSEIKMLQVKCILMNCNETVELMNLDNHIEKCLKRCVSCPYTSFGCKMVNISRDELKEHICGGIVEHSSIIIQHVSELKNNNKKLNEEMETIKNETVKYNTQYLIEQIQKELSNLNINEDRQNKEQEKTDDNRIEIKDEIKEIKQMMLEHIQENENLKKEVDEMKDKVNTQLNINEKIMEDNKKLKKEIVVLKIKFNDLTDDINSKKENMKVKNITNDITTMRSPILTDNNEEEQTNEMESKWISIIPSSILNTKSHDWFIDNYISKYNEGLNNPNLFYESAPFYLRGYQFVVLFFPYKGQTIQMKFKLIKGDYDDSINWPCSFNLRFSIIDNENKDFNYIIGTKYNKTTHKGHNESNNVWCRPANVGRLSSFCSICSSAAPLDSSKKLMENDGIKIRIATIGK